MAEPRGRVTRPPIRLGTIVLAALGLAGCIDSGNHGWDFSGERDDHTGAMMTQAWRGVHAGRIGFRCREGQVLLFVETWRPLPVPQGARVPLEMSYRFDVESTAQEQVRGKASSRGIEIPAPQVGEGAANSLLVGLTDKADELLVTLPGADLSTTIVFEIDHAANAHAHVAGDCGRPGGAA